MSKYPTFDVLVIGGGAAAAQAARVLVRNGLEVGMVDGGNTKTNDFDITEDFETIRQTYIDQYKLFLGDSLSSISFKKSTLSSSMTRGDRRYVVEEVEENLPLKTQNVEILQTLAKGGLTEIWGANCDFFDKRELEAIGLNKEDMKKPYQEVVDNVGVSGRSKNFKLLPPVLLDHNGRAIFQVYRNQRQKFKRLGLEVKLPLLALLTKSKNGRKATTYADMDYWPGVGKSMYRALITIEELEKENNFHYFKGVVVSVKEGGRNIEVLTQELTYRARFIVLAAGPLNTGRILFKSYNLYNVKFPFLTKAHIISSCLLLRNIGRKGDTKKHSLCQLVMSEATGDAPKSFYTQFYSYKSLLLFNLLNYSKLPLPESLAILSLFSSSLVLADTRFEGNTEHGGYCLLEKTKDRKDLLNVVFKDVDESTIMNSTFFKKAKEGIRNLGLIPLKHVYMPNGSTAHYAGVLGNSGGRNNMLRLNKDGRLERSRRIYVADSSGWESLPAKPPTLTIMANANRVANNLLLNFRML